MSASDHSHNFGGRRYVPAQTVKVLNRHQGITGRSWKVRVDGVVYWVALERGSTPKRIMFKPRGQNIGYWWYGVVRDEKGRELHRATVNKSAGYLSILREANLIIWQFEQTDVTA